MNRTICAILLFASFSGCDSNSNKETSTGKVIQVKSDDSEMITAMQKARDSFPDFWSEVSTDYQRAIPALTGSMVKAYFANESAPDDGEHLWIKEVTFTDNRISGVVASEPLALKTPKMGEDVTFSIDRLSDWLIIEKGIAKGAFTIQLLRSRMSESERADHDANYPFSFSSNN